MSAGHSLLDAFNDLGSVCKRQAVIRVLHNVLARFTVQLCQCAQGTDRV